MRASKGRRNERLRPLDAALQTPTVPNFDEVAGPADGNRSRPLLCCGALGCA